MKQRILMCGVLFYLLLAPGLPAKEPHHFLAILKRSSPDGYYLAQGALRTEYHFGETTVRADPVTAYIDDRSLLLLLSTLPTAIHEASHLHTDIFACREMFRKAMPVIPGYAYTYYLGRKTDIFVQLTASFPFTHLRSQIPRHAGTMRFKSLIEGDTRRSHGVYELLDEWNAYLRESVVCLDLLPEYAALQNREAYVQFFRVYSAHWTGIAEFRLYLLAYLEYARRDVPGVYRNIMRNSAFRKALREIDHRSDTHLRRYMERKQALANRLHSERTVLSELNGCIRFTFPDNSFTCVETHAESYTKLQEAMSAEKYMPIVRILQMKESYPAYRTIQSNGDL